jgi:hypothetical protein
MGIIIKVGEKKKEIKKVVEIIKRIYNCGDKEVVKEEIDKIKMIKKNL